ncbi:hypothetical protein BCR42DRAFT_426569 [Absidia repens]|uniref:Zn(2)-C6 fungal-type domain-containing protein n=1 Tax=Absidia repens TaxID=90262 RepID=A0A1X2I0M0_9FUNG|nr:hypothetical protein BCR42DRAFT_426569 [Absidia repens]
MSQSPPLPSDHTLKRKRKKVSLACVFCRRSHMTCDEGRPCQRCIKRSIGNMCHDEPRTNSNGKRKTATNINTNSTKTTTTQYQYRPQQYHKASKNGSLMMEEEDESRTYDDDDYTTSPPSNHHTTTPLPTPPNHLLEDIDDNHWDTSTSTLPYSISNGPSVNNEVTILDDFLDDVSRTHADHHQLAKIKKESIRDNFFLTAADPKDGNLEDRLNEVINAKYEAGFLKPYNYVNGYARLQRYMDQHMSSESRQRILNVMGTFRPTFRDVAQSLTDVDLILVEEAFERLLLDYDRVFSAMAIPACLWRRTGEIYKGNKEFATLIDVSVDDLRDGRLCIYEIMAEESTVNYWEKYGNIAFDARQKAVLTSCLIRHQKKQVVMSCCFSFTVRRDKYNMTIIVGNFLPIEIQN